MLSSAFATIMSSSDIVSTARRRRGNQHFEQTRLPCEFFVNLGNCQDEAQLHAFLSLCSCVIFLSSIFFDKTFFKN